MVPRCAFRPISGRESYLAANGDLPLKKTHESKFGNEIYYAETSKGKADGTAL